jgi:hypothetical protein
MSRRGYLDECVNHRLARILQERGIDATTAAEARTLGYDDESQLLVATRLGRIILTHNQRHFQQLHSRFVADGRSHAGVMLIPNGPLALVSLRAAMLFAWIETWRTVENRLIRWHDLQAELTRGFRLNGFTEAEVRQALAVDPIGT